MSKIKGGLFPIYFVVFMDNFGFGVIFNLLPIVFLNHHFHLISPSASDATRNILLAITFGVFPLTQLIGSPMIGDFADHFGRKKALYITIIAVTIGYIISGMAISINSLTLLIISRLLTGFFAGNLSVCLAAIADASKDEKSRARNFSHVTTLFGFSWILAMVLSGYISDPKYLGYNGPMIVFLITAAFSLLSFFAVWIWFDETYEVKHEMKFDLMKGARNIFEAMTLKGARVMFVIYFFWVIGWGMAIQWFPPYSMESYKVSILATTTWMTVLGITWSLGSSILNNLMLKRLHSIVIALIGSFFIAVILFVSIFVPWFDLFGSLLAFGAIFSAFTMCNTINLISMSAPADVQGKVMGLSQSTMSFGWLFSSIAAVIINRFGIHYIYWFTTLNLVIAFVLLLIVYLFRKTKRIDEGPLQESTFVDHQKG